MKIWQVVVVSDNSKGFAKGFQFRAKNITDAIKQGSEFGTVVKAVLDGWDD
ncbi:hypothetical protein SMD22_01850 (plasmid) [Brevibacillus halotolerans]|nr:hypothetical protein SMD22_01850 [Brevibacillus halotolerans]